MLVTSHLAVTLAASKAFSLQGPELIIALTSGVALDLDHLFVNRKWRSDIEQFFRSGVVTHGEVKQHSWLQEPLFGIAVGTIAGITISSFMPQIRWWIFPLFQGIHILMDGFMRYEHQPFIPFSEWRYWGWIRSGSKTQFVASSIILIIVLLA